MIELRNVLNLKADIIGDESDIEQCCIIGQEQNGQILYSYHKRHFDKEGQSEEDNEQTYIACYNQHTKDSKVLYINERRITVVNASVTQENTFLAFVAVEETLVSGPGGKKNKQDTYSAYLIEIGGQQRLFSLNLDRNHYIKVQFLYGAYRGKVANRETHLLVFLHKESIALYHFPLARAGDHGMMISGEPRKDTVFYKSFIWSQWDAQGQRLHLVCFRKTDKTAYGGKIYKPILLSYQFNEDTQACFMLEVQLDIPIPYVKSTKRVNYLSPASWPIIPDADLNIEVLTLPNGTYCLCYQHEPPELQSDRPLPTTVPLKYSVCLLHNGHILQCDGPSLPYQISSRCRLLFAWIGEHLLVHLPGWFSHLLCVSSEFEPQNHILYENTEDKGLDGCSTVYCPFRKDKPPASHNSDLCVLDCNSHTVQSVHLDHDVLLRLFTTSTERSTKLALLQYAVTGLRDVALISSMFRCLTKDVTNPDIPILMEEFLLAGCYIGSIRQINRSISQFISYSSGQPYSIQRQTDCDGKTVCSLSYADLREVTCGRADKKQPSDKSDVLWDSLAVCVSDKRGDAHRMCNREIKMVIDDQGVNENEITETHLHYFNQPASPPRSESETDVESSQRSPSKLEQILRAAPPFLTDKTVPIAKDQQLLMAKTLELVTNHFFQQLKTESIAKVRNLAAEYVWQQMKQSSVLSHIIWSIQDSDVEFSTDLNSAGTPPELECFLWYERYYLAVSRLGFPFPPGFCDFFMHLGFRCLKPRLFLQYMDNQILQITDQFALSLIKDLNDSSVNVQIKVRILSKLPKSMSDRLLKTWDHPIAYKYCKEESVPLAEEAFDVVGYESFVPDS